MKKKLILTSALAMVMAGSVMAGATYALFTSESKTNLTVTSGTVDVRSSVLTDTIKLSSRAQEMPGLVFANGGTVKLEGNRLSLDKMTPGDKVTFDFEIANYSNVATKYRCALNCASGYELFGKLKITFDAAAPWTDLAPADPSNPTKLTSTVTIELPEEVGNDYQGLNTELAIVVEAIQGNGDVSDTIADNAIKATTGTAPIPETVGRYGVTVYSESGAVKVKAPKNRLTESTATELNLNVKPVSASAGNFTLKSNENAVYYDIDLQGIDDSGYSCEVTMFVGKGLTGVRVLHDENGVEDQLYSDYDPETGFVFFKTPTFSVFAIVAQKALTLGAKNDPVLNTRALQEAVNNNGVVTLNEDLVLAHTDVLDGEMHVNPVINVTNDLKLNLNGHKISLADAPETVEDVPGIIAINEGAKKVEVYGNGSIDAEYGMNTAYAFNVNAPEATLTIKDGSYTGGMTAVQVSKGHAIIEGGHYEVTKSVGSVEKDRELSKYLINCIDGNYNAGLAEVDIEGGEFVKFNPAVVDCEAKNAETGEYEAFAATGTVTYAEGNVYHVVENSVFDDNFKAPTYTLNSDLFLTFVAGPFSALDIRNDLVLDLNGHNIVGTIRHDYSGRSTPMMFGLMGSNTHVTVKGEGNIIANVPGTLYVFDVDGGSTLNLTSGHYVGSPDVVYVEDGTLNVTGGRYELSSIVTKQQPDMVRFLLNCDDYDFKAGRAHINVTGGEFVNYDPSHANSEPTADMNWVPATHTSTGTAENGNTVYRVTKIA